MTDTALEAMKLVRDIAANAEAELRRNAGNGSSARPTVKQINGALDRLASIVKLMDEVVLPVYNLPPIPHASDIERRIVGKVVECLLAAGFKISVNDGGDEDVLVCSTDAAEIFAALSSTGMDTIRVHGHPNRRRSFVDLVWGNGVDVISDYGMSLEEVLAPANELAEALDDRGQS